MFSIQNSSVEFINVEIYNNVQKILISCVYNPSKLFSLEPYFTDFDCRITNYDFYVTCGDFNINLFHEDNYSDALKDYVSSAGLSIVNTQTATRFAPNCNPSLLDIFLLSNMRSLLLFDQISFVSDHDLLFCTVNITFDGDDSTREITYRDFKQINYQMLSCDLGNINMSSCWQEATVDGKVSNFN